jgi:NAD(P)-dependent dehydrogenase (short-subunit alcohol dehydrogenase family)
MMDPKLRAALVTGGGRGIGRGIALALASRGWQVAINYRNNRDAALATQQAVHEAGGSGAVIQADIADGGQRQRLVAETLEAFGRIDLLVNNAGMAPRQRCDLLETSEESYDEVMAVNLKGPFFLTQLVARTLIELLEQGAVKDPKIVNIGSVSAYASSVQRGEYCLSKAGLAMMTALFAHRLAEYGIYVYEVRPGIIDTDMTRGVRDRYDALLAAGLAPIQRWGQPADVAQAVVAIAEGYLPYSTGEVINVDGGYHLRRL